MAKRGVCGLLALLLLSSFLMGCVQSLRIDLFDEEEFLATVLEDETMLKAFTDVETAQQFDSYVSVLQFDVSTDETDESIVVQEPKVRALIGESVIQPIISGVEDEVTIATDDYDFPSSVTLQLAFNCLKEGEATVEIKFTFVINGKNKKYVVHLSKECLGQDEPRGGFMIGTQKDAKDVVRHGIPQSAWSLQSFEFEDEEPTSVSNKDHATTFLIFMEGNWGNQGYYEPSIDVSDDQVLSVEARGSASKGNVASSKQVQQLVLSYKCLSAGVATLQITIDLFDSYTPIVFGFIKQCSERVIDDEPALLNVGLGTMDLKSVAINNTPKEAWKPESPSFEVSKHSHSTVFFVTSTTNKAEFITPVVTTVPTNLLDVTVTGEGRHGGVADPETAVSFALNFFCKKAGKVDVTVLIHQPSHNTLEFGFIKDCAPTVDKKSDTWTANQLMVLTSFLIAILAFVAYNSFKTSSQVTEIEKRPSAIPITPERVYV